MTYKTRKMFHTVVSAVGLLFLFIVIVSVPVMNAEWIGRMFPGLEYGEMGLSHVFNSVTIVAAVWGVINWRKINAYFNSVRFRKTGHPVDKRISECALLTPVSGGRANGDQNRWIFNYLHPQYVYMVYTEQSRRAALDLLKEYKNSGIYFFQHAEEIDRGEWMIRDVFDIKEVKETAKELLEEMVITAGINKRDIAVDVTAGTAVMSLGLFQAAEEMSVSTIYIQGNEKSNIIEPGKHESGNPRYINQAH
ncbi:hypothetical protein JXO52_03795 [bacterium]|nr:hypothetical protein [bacterium]